MTVIAVTDHNTIKGSLKTKNLAKNKPITVFTGVEIKTNLGDIIGLFVREEIREYNFLSVIDEIKNKMVLLYYLILLTLRQTYQKLI